MAVGRPGNFLISRPSGKLHSVRLSEVSSGAAAPSDATIVPSGLNDTKFIQPDLFKPTPISFTNCRARLSLRAIPGKKRIRTILIVTARQFVLPFKRGQLLFIPIVRITQTAPTGLLCSYHSEE